MDYKPFTPPPPDPYIKTINILKKFKSDVIDEIRNSNSNSNSNDTNYNPYNPDVNDNPSNHINPDTNDNFNYTYNNNTIDTLQTTPIVEDILTDVDITEFLDTIMNKIKNKNVEGNQFEAANDVNELNNIVNSVNSNLNYIKQHKKLPTNKDNDKPYKYIQKNMGILVKDEVKPFAENPSGILFLFITKHGGYEIVNFKYKIDLCEVNNLIRYTYAPKGACSWGSHPSNVYDYKELHDSLKNLNNYTDILTELNLLADCNKKSDLIKNNYREINGMKKDILEKDICKTKTHNKIFTNNLGDFIINKSFSLHLDNDMTSGFVILFDVSFRLPDIFFAKEENIDLIKDILKKENRFRFKIGKIDIPSKTITYEGNTELTSCPYFKAYLHFSGANWSLTPAYSLSDDFDLIDGELIPKDPVTISPKGTSRGMANYVTSKDIYGYFKYVNIVVNIDYSCGSFVAYNTLNKVNSFNKLGKVKCSKKLRKLGLCGKYDIYGGKNKTHKKKKYINRRFNRSKTNKRGRKNRNKNKNK
jgi:hypothetical protein